MTINAQIVDQRVRRVASDMSEPFRVEVGISNDAPKLHSAAFVFLVVKTLLGLPNDDTIDCIVDGGQDFGVDAIFTGPVQDNEFRITLVQGKYKQNLEGAAEFPESGVKDMVLAISTLFDPGKSVTVNGRLQAKLEEIRYLVADGAIPTVHAILCNNGKRWNSVSQEHIDRSGLGDQVSWQHIGPDEVINLLQAAKPVVDTIQLSGKFIVENFDYRRVLIGRMAVSQLSALFQRHGDRLLERNIRRYLGLTGNRVNEGVATTLRDGNQRSNFYFYNNGITIICTQFRHNALREENTSVQIDGLQIVNGGQTSKTVQQVVSEVGPEVGEAQVLVWVYELAQNDDDLVQSITYATNSQNPVDLRDLRSNDSRQVRLGQAIAELGYSYRRQRSDQIASGREITSVNVAESILAVWRRRPHQARFNVTEHFGKLYDVIFTEQLNGAQAVIAALVSRIPENRRKRPPADAPDFLTYASRFAAMMMGIYLLADMAIDLEGLDHRNFAQAERLIETKGETYYQRALEQIGGALEPLFTFQPRTLQRLSATFRRGDLVETLTGSPVKAR